MGERDLDRYLEGLGIDIDGQREATPPDDDSADESVGPESWSDDGEDLDFERALAGIGLGSVVPDDLPAVQRAESFLVQLLLYFDPTYTVDVVEAADGTLDIEVAGGDPGRLIGKGGRTLSAIEYLVAAVVNKRDGGEALRVSLDVGGYKRRRDERLRIVAQRAAARVRKTGMPVELDPMSAAERRVVHMALADDPMVESESSGEGRDRRVVVYPVRSGA